MSKQEFLDSLRRALSGNMEYAQVEEHLRYYSDYIDSQIRYGGIEEEVMAKLGDPRLIAKTILEFDGKQTVTEEYIDEEEKKDNAHYYSFNGRTFSVPGWLSSTIISLLLIVVLSIVFALFAGLLRFAFPIIMFIFLFRTLMKMFK